MGGKTKSYYLALIPKDSNPTTFNRYRPISLYNFSYTIITKIISNRIMRLLPKVISKNQGGFVPNRQIKDNVIVFKNQFIPTFKGNRNESL